MESKAFRICPFCQSATPVSDDRCVGCRRSLVGLSLPVYGSEIDAALARPAPAALVDLPLRDAPKPVAAEPRPRSQPRGTKAIVAFAIMLAAIVGVLLARGHGRPSPPARTASTLPPPAAERPMSDVDTARAPSPEPAEPAPVPARLPEGVPARLPARSPAPMPRRAALPPSLAPPPAPTPSPATSARTAAVPATRTPAAAPIPRRPAAQVYTVHPDVRSGPVDVARAEDDFRAHSPAAEPIEPPEAGAAAGLRDRLARARERRDAIAERVDRLRARTNVPVIRDLDGYEQDQADLARALDDLDRADAEVARLRRLVGGRD